MHSLIDDVQRRWCCSTIMEQYFKQERCEGELISLLVLFVIVCSSFCNSNVVSHLTRWSFSFILGPLHWSCIFPTSREQRNIVQLWTNSNGDRALPQIGCSVCGYHLIWIDCVTSQLIWRKIGVTVNICLTHNWLCLSWWKTGTLSGETCLLAKEKAKGGHMLVTIGTIRATAIIIITISATAIRYCNRLLPGSQNNDHEK